MVDKTFGQHLQPVKTSPKNTINIIVKPIGLRFTPNLKFKPELIQYKN